VRINLILIIIHFVDNKGVIMGERVGEEVNRLLTSFVEWLPRLISALVIFVVGWILAAVLRSIVDRALIRMGFNRWVYNSPADSFARKVSHDPARTIGNILYWLVIAITITVVIGTLDIPVLTMIVSGFYAYVPNILAAILILALGLAASAAVAGALHRWMADTASGRILAIVIPVVIMSIAGFAILEQLRIAPAVVLATYIAIVGALSLGFAIAFGLGGADAAGQIMDNAYTTGRKKLDQAKVDMERGRDRAQKDKERVEKKKR
jgi:hypothetical protein